MESFFGNTNKLSEVSGYWGPKSSSVNFCEEDYYLSHYIGEFHNAWTSLVFVFLPLVGLIYSNPLKELRTVWCFLQLIITGVGSIALHTTLTSWGQACDEIPMLWMCSAILYNLVTIEQPRSGHGFCKWTVLIPAFVIYQTIVYVYFQSLYSMFLVGYIAMVVIIVAWAVKLSWFEAEQHSEIRRYLCKRAVGAYVLVGSVAWLVDMHYCDSFASYSRMLGGVTFHVWWHFGAGYGTYILILLLVAARVQNLGLVPAVEWWGFGLCPIVKVVKPSSYDQ